MTGGSGLGHVPALDGLRGIAIALVVAYHVGWIDGGFFGVDLFFALSGFLITSLLLAELDARGRLDLRAFYIRRARRLLPALFALLVALAIVGGGSRSSIEAVAAAAFYAENFVRAAADVQTFAVSAPAGHVWSLAQEEQFYLLWPVLLAVVFRRRRLVLAFGVLLAALACYRLGLLAAGVSHHRLYFAPDTHADPLVAGCLVAVLRHRGRLPSLRRVMLPAALLLGAAAVAFHMETAASLGLGIPAVAAASSVLVAGATEAGWLSRLLASRVLVWLGAISYSLYLWHPLVVWYVGKSVVAVGLSLALAWLSYRYIEEPFRRRRRVPATAVVGGA